MHGNPNPSPETRWKPGQSGNPRGRQPRRPLSEAHDNLLRQEIPQEMLRSLNLAVVNGVRKDMKILGPHSTWADAIALAMVRTALRGDAPAAKELREAVEGKATQRIELLALEDRQIELSVVFEQSEFSRKFAPEHTKQIDLEPEQPEPEAPKDL